MFGFVTADDGNENDSSAVYRFRNILRLAWFSSCQPSGAFGRAAALVGRAFTTIFWLCMFTHE
jgi:hypothetical protein